MSFQTQTLTIFFSTEICFQADHEKLLRRNFSWRKPFCSGRCWVTDSVIFLRWEEDLTSFWWVLDVGGPPFGTAKVMTTALFYVGCELSLFLLMWMLVFLWDWELLRRDTLWLVVKLLWPQTGRLKEGCDQKLTLHRDWRWTVFTSKHRHKDYREKRRSRNP